MKQKYSIFLLAILLTFVNISNAQTPKNHFDNKKFVEGEMLVQVISNGKINEIINRAPVDYNLIIKKSLSVPMSVWLFVWLVSFDRNVVDENKINIGCIHSQKFL